MRDFLLSAAASAAGTAPFSLLIYRNIYKLGHQHGKDEGESQEGSS